MCDRFFENVSNRSSSRIVNDIVKELVPPNEATDWDPRNLYDDLDGHTHESKHQEECIFTEEFEVDWNIVEES